LFAPAIPDKIVTTGKTKLIDLSGTKLNSYLTPYIQKNVIGDEALADALKFELDRRIYHYGDHFLKSYETNHTSKLNKMALCLRKYYLAGKIALKSRENIPPHSIVSNSYFGIKNTLSSKEHNFIRPPWDPSVKAKSYFDLNSYNSSMQLKSKVTESDFNTIISGQTVSEMKAYQALLEDFLNHKNIVAGLFPNDAGFFETLSLHILKKLNKVTFLTMHGVPAFYGPDLYSRSDYLLVWGKALKENYMKVGFPESKIKVVGHPFFKSYPKEVRSSLDSILVLTAPLQGSQHYRDQVVIRDRGASVLYCYLVQKCLTSLGIKKVKIRPHPSENCDWYSKFLDMNFFEFDHSTNIHQSVQNSSLVIGPSSTSALETLSHGTNYIVFEPFQESKNTYPLVSPFDGSDERLVVCKSEDDLIKVLRANKKSDPQILEDYFGTENRLDRTISELLP
jgi:hypothetical protein